MEFGERIKMLREKKAISQRQFAISLDITPTYLSKIERGEFQPPSEAIIKKMADFLGVDSDILLSYAGKVDSKLLEIIKQDPEKFGGLLRRQANKGES